MRYRSPIVFAVSVLAACGGASGTDGGKPLEDVRPAAPAVATSPAAGDEKVDPAPVPAAPVWIAEGFSTPESVLYVPEEDAYLVSNIDGSPVEADKKGFISKVSPDGEVLALRWIDSATKGVILSAPKGMGVSGGKLYVADIDRVAVFDLATGKFEKSTRIVGATFLNDVAVAADGTVYVSDSGLKVTAKGFEPSGTDAVWKVPAKGRPTRVTPAKADLGRPNGLAALESGVWVVTFGAAELFRLGEKGAKADVTVLPAGGLDGVVQGADGTLYVASWDGKTVFAGKPGASFAPAWPGVVLESPADLAHDPKRNRLIIPLFTQNKVVALGTGSPSASR